MPDNEIIVSVPQKWYEELLGMKARYELLIKTIVESAALDWSKKALNFDDTLIGNVIDVFYPGLLDKKLVALQQEAIEAAKAKEVE